MRSLSRGIGITCRKYCSTVYSRELDLNAKFESGTPYCSFKR